MKPRHIMIAMLGSVLACFLTASAAEQTERGPRGGDIDLKPYLAEAYIHTQIQAILLQRMQANCPAETKRAVMFDLRAPLAWFGCWRERGGKVEIAFEDGDFLSLEHDNFVWLSETGA
jgi:hypothetical protein